MWLASAPLLLALVTTAPSLPGAPVSQAVTGSGALLAQRAPGEGLGRRPERPRQRLSPEQREQMRAEVQRKMQTFVTVELATRLGLDDKRALQLSSAFAAHQQRQQARREAMRTEYRALKDLLEKGGASDSAVRAQTDKVVAASATARGADAELFQETKKFLSVEQQARLVLALPEVHREMRQMMRRAGGGRGKGGPPDDDE